MVAARAGRYVALSFMVARSLEGGTMSMFEVFLRSILIGSQELNVCLLVSRSHHISGRVRRNALTDEMSLACFNRRPKPRCLARLREAVHKPPLSFCFCSQR